MTQSPQIVTHADGSIDMTHYRRRAHQARGEACRTVGAATRTLLGRVMTAMIGLIA